MTLDIEGATVIIASAGGTQHSFGVFDRLGDVAPAAQAGRHQAAQGSRVGEETSQPFPADLRELACLLPAVEEATTAVSIPQTVREHPSIVQAVVGEEASDVAVFTSHLFDASAEGEGGICSSNPKLWPQVDLHLAWATCRGDAVYVCTHAVHTVH